MISLLSPATGTVVALQDVPDPVFANQLVGSGCAVNPDRDATAVYSPVAGTVAKVHPHAFVIITDDETGVLCHVGIDTVRLEGDGFDVLIKEGDIVTAGQHVLSWNPADIEEKGLSPLIMLAVLDTEPDAFEIKTLGEHVQPGATLFEVA